jgi:hypothetical protein
MAHPLPIIANLQTHSSMGLEQIRPAFRQG